MSAGASSVSTDNRFQRRGTSATSSFRTLTPTQSSGFASGLSATAPGSANAGVDAMLAERISSEYGDTPYRPELCQLIRSNMPGVAVPGENSLNAQAGNDPFSGAYAENTFDRYQNEMQRAMAGARSGPTMTRGGTAAQGFAQAEAANNASLNREDVVRGNRNTDAQISQSAAGTLSGIDQARDGAALAGIGASDQNFWSSMASRMSGAGLASERVKMFNDLVATFTSLGSTMNGTESNNLTGRGSQTSSSMGVGMNVCCFIFLEAYNGQLPWYVRAYRDKHAPESSARRAGYISMSKWLVPLMRSFRGGRWMVNHLLVKPLTKYGGWVYGVNSWGWVMWPVKKFWFTLWSLIGKDGKDV